MNPDFLDILSAFSEERVEFLVVGAYALAVHGLPRATGDIDLWVRPTRDNARRVRAALARFGAPIGNLVGRDVLAKVLCRVKHRSCFQQRYFNPEIGEDFDGRTAAGA